MRNPGNEVDARTKLAAVLRMKAGHLLLVIQSPREPQYLSTYIQLVLLEALLQKPGNALF